MYRVRSYPFVFIENQVGKMVVIIASMMMLPYLAGSWRRWGSSETKQEQGFNEYLV